MTVTATKVELWGHTNPHEKIQADRSAVTEVTALLLVVAYATHEGEK